MGLFSRFKAKEERLYKDPETGKTSWVPVERKKASKYATISNPQTGESVRVRRDERPLTAKEQFKPRVQPWNTPRGKKTVKSIKSGVSRLDKAVVNYNRHHNPVGSRKPRYSTRNNYNPFGDMFDTGLDYKPYKPKAKKSSSTKYYVSGGKAYPIAGSKKKKSRKRSSDSYLGYDMTDNWGFF